MKRKLIIAAAVVMSCAGLMAQPTAWSEPQLLIKAEQSLMAPVWSPDGSKMGKGVTLSDEEVAILKKALNTRDI